MCCEVLGASDLETSNGAVEGLTVFDPMQWNKVGSDNKKSMRTTA